ncbi:MAG TPA: VOC family protein [Chloroflexota bacterium]|jgi:catechol 2,3-dioxygenase-like lactoylglutathione lyase family enzyme
MHKEALPNPSDELPTFYGLEPEEDDLVERFSHFTIAVTDLDRSEAWYRDVIGMDVVGRNLIADERPNAILRMNTGQLFILIQHESIDQDRLNSQGVHHGFALTQSQYIRAVQRLRDHGIPVVAYREEFISRGQYSIDVEDPDGHHYQIETMDEVQAHEIIFPTAGVIDCGPADGYQVGDVKPFRDGTFYLSRVGEGFLALSRWCTHMNSLIVYQPEHWRFWCPMHVSTFDRHGNSTSSSGAHADQLALRLHPISFSPDGHVLVDTSQIIERDVFRPGDAVLPPGHPAIAR